MTLRETVTSGSLSALEVIHGGAAQLLVTGKVLDRTQRCPKLCATFQDGDVTVIHRRATANPRNDPAPLGNGLHIERKEHRHQRPDEEAARSNATPQDRRNDLRALVTLCSRYNEAGQRGPEGLFGVDLFDPALVKSKPWTRLLQAHSAEKTTGSGKLCDRAQ